MDFPLKGGTGVGTLHTQRSISKKVIVPRRKPTVKAKKKNVKARERSDEGETHVWLRVTLGVHCRSGACRAIVRFGLRAPERARKIER